MMSKNKMNCDKNQHIVLHSISQQRIKKLLY